MRGGGGQAGGAGGPSGGGGGAGRGGAGGGGGPPPGAPRGGGGGGGGPPPPPPACGPQLEPLAAAGSAGRRVARSMPLRPRTQVMPLNLLQGAASGPSVGRRGWPPGPRACRRRSAQRGARRSRR